MVDVNGVGRVLLVTGIVLAVAGGAMLLAGQFPWLGWLGRLPGDLVLRRGPVTIYFPIIASIIVSVVLTIALNLILRR